MTVFFHPRRRWTAVLAALALVCAISGCASPPAVSGSGLFSWSEEALAGTARDELFRDMAACGLTVLYQSIPGDAEADAVGDFLRAAAEREIAVYLLTGAPDWGLDPSGGRMTEAVERCAQYNRGLPAGTGLRGVMMDAEPYLTEEWDIDPAGAMDAYVSGMAAAREAARGAGLQYVACIPWFYEEKGLAEALGRLIATGCDGLAVMNYQKRNEAGQIETEVALAREAGIPVTVIYELQAPGGHGLTERNTYHSDGLGAVAESFRALEARFGGDALFYALHDSRALQEVLNRE